uniref:Transcription factor bHLH155-like isoform X2 n=1 Tax=Nicotiana tabacum TaxID=4097 RepID=A0A1S4AED4_TOBAC|nr:PREDICTED: transcription factor bHLH155-like isoform X2 [Nicotiana tabacum]
MEEQLSSLAVTHLLQHSLRSLCIHENSQWVYAVFWRILPRNYPPPKWDSQGGAYDRSRGNRRNWILVWEDGFCNFAASTAEMNGNNECQGSSTNNYGEYQGLQPELFFKMSHEIYNYGEGIIGKVAADHSHKWIYKEPNEQEINFLSAWHNSADSHPRTWEAQFRSGIKTIALIAVREGVIQLGAVHKHQPLPQSNSDIFPITSKIPCQELTLALSTIYHQKGGEKDQKIHGHRTRRR